MLWHLHTTSAAASSCGAHAAHTYALYHPPPCAALPATTEIEKRWTIFSTFWYLVQQTRFLAIPPALRFIFHLGWRVIMTQAYNVHKAVVLWREWGTALFGRGQW